MPVNEDDAASIINPSPFNEGLTAMEEVMHIPYRLKANNVIGAKTLTYRLPHGERKEPPVVRSRPGDVVEVLKEDIW